MSQSPDEKFDHGTVTEEVSPEVQRPPLFKVYLINDDYTPMEFVVDVLMNFFSMTKEKATQIMLQVHYRGKGVCGVYTREIAETKVNLVNDHARGNQHPLLCSMEEV